MEASDISKGYTKSVENYDDEAKPVDEMTPQERLASLQQFAEEKKYARPGQDGTLPGGIAGMQSMVFGGPAAVFDPGQEPPRIAEPQHGTPQVTRDRSKSNATTGSTKMGGLKGWLERRKEKKLEKEQGNGY